MRFHITFSADMAIDNFAVTDICINKDTENDLNNNQYSEGAKLPTTTFSIPLKERINQI